MKNLRVLLLVVFTFVSILCAFANNIKLNFPSLINQNYIFYTYNGLQVDTLKVGKLNMLGQDSFAIPADYDSIGFMGILSFDEKNKFDIIVNKESVSVTETKDGLDFGNSLENNLLHHRQKEIENPEYANTFVNKYSKITQAIYQMGHLLQQPKEQGLRELVAVRQFAVKNIDPDVMYYTKFWYFGIDYLLSVSSGEENFGDNIVELLKKTKSQKVFEGFAQNLVDLTLQYGMDEAFDIIIPYIDQTNRIEDPQGSIYEAFVMSQVRKGVEAPKLDGIKNLDKNAKYDLLVFHKPGCEHCAIEMQKVIASYDEITKYGAQIISISGAFSEPEFNEETKDYPWKSKNCDFKAYNGENFKNYGIMATPTFYLINPKTNIVIGRYSTISKVLVKLMQLDMDI